MSDAAIAPDVRARLFRLAGTAVIIVVIFAAAAAVLSDGDVLAPGPEAVAAGAAGAALVLSRADSRLNRLATRLIQRVRATPYETVAGVAGRLAMAVATEDTISHVTSALQRGLGAERVEIQVGAGLTAPAGRSPDYRVPVTHDADGKLAEILVFKEAGLTAQECRLVDDVAASSVIALSTALAAAELERRTGELAGTLDQLASSRRALVVAEQRQREAMARGLDAELQPLFSRLRAEIRAGSFDAAATSAEALVDALRSVSTAVIAGGELR